MCKTWAVVHGCGHTVAFRLSTCRGTYTHTTRKSKTPATLCRGSPSWGFKSELRCGSCSKADEEQRLEAEIEQIRMELADVDDWLMDAERGYHNEVWKLNTKYPDGRFKKLVRPEKGPEATRRSSVLRNEVLPEDLDAESSPASRPSLLSTPSWESQWNWASGWASLDDEVTEDEQERADSGSPPSSTDTWETNGWNDPEPIDSEPVLVEPESPPELQSSEAESPPELKEPHSPARANPRYIDEGITMMDYDDEAEEDLFTFPAERFRRIHAPVEDHHTTHSMSYMDVDDDRSKSGRVTPVHDRRRKRTNLTDQMSNGFRSLQNCGGGWSMEFAMTN